MLKIPSSLTKFGFEVSKDALIGLGKMALQFIGGGALIGGGAMMTNAAYNKVFKAKKTTVTINTPITPSTNDNGSGA